MSNNEKFANVIKNFKNENKLNIFRRNDHFMNIYSNKPKHNSKNIIEIGQMPVIQNWPYI